MCDKASDVFSDAAAVATAEALSSARAGGGLVNVDELAVRVGDDAALGYRIQTYLAGRRRLHTDEPCSGYKIALTTPTVQEVMGAAEPVYGAFIRSEILRSGAEVPLAAMNQPLLETEFALIPRRTVGPTETLEDLAAACDVALALEIPDSRFVDWWPGISLGELVADSAGTGLLVVDDKRFQATEILRNAVEVALYRDDQLVETVGGVEGTAALDNLRWLARMLERHGQELAAGAIVATGSLTQIVSVAAGTYVADFGELGAVAVTFAG